MDGTSNTIMLLLSVRRWLPRGWAGTKADERTFLGVRGTKREGMRGYFRVSIHSSADSEGPLTKTNNYGFFKASPIR